MKSSYLILITVLAGVAYALLDITKVETKTPYYDLQIAAAEKMQEAMASIKALREDPDFGWSIDGDLDPLYTGIIGDASPHWDDPSITTTLGILDSKLISTNPGFAALMVRYFIDLRLQEGDSVAINFSGSFPALNIATLAAVEVIGLNPVIASSIGASSYGANNPNFTWIDMEEHLYHEGVFSHRSTWISFGGDNDQLREEEDEAFKANLKARYDKEPYVFIDEDDFSRNISYRYRAYHSAAIQIRAFVNVGGNQVSFGTHRTSFPNGLTKRMSISIVNGSGLIERFLRDDIPVIHLLNIRDLAKRNGLPIDYNSPFVMGESALYYVHEHSKVGTTVTISGLSASVILPKILVRIGIKRKGDSGE